LSKESLILGILSTV